MTEHATADVKLKTLSNRTRTTGAKAIAHSRNIRRLRLVLPVIGVVLAVAFFMSTRSSEPEDALLREAREMTISNDELIMASPRFAGIDDSGKPFEITAEAATQNPAARDVVELDFPQATQGESTEITTISATRGVYHSDANLLELVDNVKLEHTIASGKYTFEAPAALVSMNDDIVTSDSGVGGAGPDGMAIKADRMKAYNAEGRVVLQGNVSMRLFPKKKEETLENGQVE